MSKELEKLGAQWIDETVRELNSRRTRLIESLQRLKHDGAYAKSHKVAIAALDRMIAAAEEKP